MLKYINNSVGTITLNLSTKLVFSVVAACPLWRDDSGSLISFQPTNTTEKEPESKELKPNIYFFWGGQKTSACTSQPHSRIAKICMHMLPWAVGCWNHSFISLTENAFLMIHLIYFVHLTESGATFQRTQSKPVSPGVEASGLTALWCFLQALFLGLYTRVVKTGRRNSIAVVWLRKKQTGEV